MRRLRAFELFVMSLVLGVVICFCIQLSYIRDTKVGEVFRGYLPSKAIVESEGLVKHSLLPFDPRRSAGEQAVFELWHTRCHGYAA